MHLDPPKRSEERKATFKKSTSFAALDKVYIYNDDMSQMDDLKPENMEYCSSQKTTSKSSNYNKASLRDDENGFSLNYQASQLSYT